MADKVEWQFNLPKAAGGDLALLAKFGHWTAELGKDEVYSEGEVFVRYNGVVPAFFGQANAIPEPENAMALIAEVTRMMVLGLVCSQPCGCKCQNVYVVSLNEGDFERAQNRELLELGLHFRLLPRYQHDEDFLKKIEPDGRGNDGLALMAKWREQFLRRQKTREWGDFPQPWDDNDVKQQDKWRKYAERIRGLLQGAVESRTTGTELQA